MNENVCRLCKRYAGKSSFTRGWLCASVIFLMPSKVIPGCSYYVKDNFHPITEDRKVLPEWCEKPLEQVVLNPDASVPDSIRKDGLVQFDGNSEWNYHLRSRKNQ